MGRPSVCWCELLGDLALEFKRSRRQLGVARLGQEGIEPATVIDAAERIGGNPKSHRAAERVGNQGDIYQVRQKAPLSLDVRVADLVADLGRFAGQFAPPRHGVPLDLMRSPPMANSLESWLRLDRGPIMTWVGRV